MRSFKMKNVWRGYPFDWDIFQNWDEYCFGNSIILSSCINLYSFNIFLKKEMKARKQLLVLKKCKAHFFGRFFMDHNPIALLPTTTPIITCLPLSSAEWVESFYTKYSILCLFPGKFVGK